MSREFVSGDGVLSELPGNGHTEGCFERYCHAHNILDGLLSPQTMETNFQRRLVVFNFEIPLSLILHHSRFRLDIFDK